MTSLALPRVNQPCRLLPMTCRAQYERGAPSVMGEECSRLWQLLIMRGCQGITGQLELIAAFPLQAGHRHMQQGQQYTHMHLYLLLAFP